MQAAMLPRRRMLIHGGRSGAQAEVCSAELSVLSLETLAWSRCESRYARVGHVATELRPTGAAPLFLFIGGLKANTMSAETWQLTSPDASLPTFTRMRAEQEFPERFAHVVASIGDRAFVFGGSSQSGELDDLLEGRLS
mmetsp:Transcript_19103/g.37113  ORF Transcript_19103/g.37113 Transcript_19103/m.37113 type:complete len:139 (+) Transcript_19103:3-419(+)